ncbi:MAG: DUF2958 domain-containing protein [Chloroflexi bacterium]|nr:DUF2958 domain-containing protein [Chloroflexota bacterium]MYE41367.1 DUF2958 domain-containing protein [Chloroflexota bacterium]
MTDQRETTATMWQDQHSGKRGHQLMTEKLAETIPAIYANEKVADYDTVLAHAKLFSPYSNWTWFITEMDPETGQCFGLVEGFERELGYFDLTELAETTVFGGVPAVERDLYWEPKTLGEIRNGPQGDSQHSKETGKGETMTDDNEMEVHGPDVVNVEEFLFGGVTEETADDAPADVGGELPTTEATGDASDGETADEPDADMETANEEPDASDDAGEQAATAEAESSDGLKVVLSIRGGRATIGVQRPSADPHIESFDDPDLFGLADEFPAVVARAKARWEEEPMHPAYVKPAPPARRRNRRQQGTAQAATTEGETEAEQQTQPETLRLF